MQREGLKAARLLMVLSSIAPLFVLIAIRGIAVLPDTYLVGACSLLIALPAGFLWLRVSTAMRLRETREIVVGSAEDHREHLLVYLFAMLLPLYTADFSNWRNVTAALVALAFIVFLFWHLNLHYMNVMFAARGYRVFTIYPPRDSNPLTGMFSQVLITKRTMLMPGDRIVAYRISDTVYFEGVQ
jgi:hypothetical protein